MFADASAATRAQGKKGGQWIYVSHALAEPQQVMKALLGYCNQADNGQGGFLGGSLEQGYCIDKHNSAGAALPSRISVSCCVSRLLKET